MARIAIVGSRDFANLDAVRQFVREQERDAVIISGGASGVDQAAVDEARRLAMAYEVYRPDWATHGKRAGALRNAEIVAKADEVVAFWDGRSKGTKITMDMARQSGKMLRIFFAGASRRLEDVLRPMTWPELVALELLKHEGDGARR